MTPALKLFAFINSRSPEDRHGNRQSVIKDRYIAALEDVPNNYGSDKPDIPAGSYIVMDFGGDFGFYGTADVGGKLVRCRVELENLHKLDWSPFLDEIEASA